MKIVQPILISKSSQVNRVGGSISRDVRVLTLIVAGLSQVVEVNLVGRLFGSDIVLLVALPFVLVSYGRALLMPLPKSFLIFACLWFLGAVLTDAIRETPFDDLVRGWSKIIFFVINFISIYLLVGQSGSRLIVFLLSLFFGATIKLRFFPSDEVGSAIQGADILGVAWRFGYGHAFTFLLFVLSAFSSKVVPIGVGRLIPFAAAAINLSLQARNLFGITSIASVLALLSSPSNRKRLSTSTLVLMGVGGLAACWFLLAIYGWAAAGGLLGEEARVKYEVQSSGAYGVLLGGRTESVASTQAIIDSPIIGHGSWARDMQYVTLRIQALREAGYEIVGNPFQSDLIPSHSILLGSWVEAGILGALFWFWALWLNGRALFVIVMDRSPTLGPVAFVLLSFTWDILFSPFGAERRFVVPAYLCTAMLAIGRRV